MPAIVAITFHEAAHGFAADMLGDDTAWQLGRVSFNPARHIDLFGTILLPAFLLLVGAPFLPPLDGGGIVTGVLPRALEHFSIRLGAVKHPRDGAPEPLEQGNGRINAPFGDLIWGVLPQRRSASAALSPTEGWGASGLIHVRAKSLIWPSVSATAGCDQLVRSPRKTLIFSPTRQWQESSFQRGRHVLSVTISMVSSARLH
jgi:hypothetical protein